MEEPVILYEDNHLLVAVKPQNVPSQGDESGDPDFLSILKGYIKDKYGKPGNVFLGLVHRLDRPTGGVMCFARTGKAAERLCACIKDGAFEKRYAAVTVGRPRFPSGRASHYLLKNEKENTVSVVRADTAGAKLAELEYKILEAADPVSLVGIRLLTGRSHQARVQMKALGAPIFGDARYGGDTLAKGYNLALWAYGLRFPHPITKEILSFTVFPPAAEEPWKRFSLEKHFNVKPE